MSDLGAKKSLPKSIGRARRRSADANGAVVKPYFDDGPYPVLVKPAIEGTPLAPWAAENRDWIEQLFWDKRSLLFRGWDLGGTEGFEQVVDAVSFGERLAYKDRSTPRKTYGDRIYNATVYPNDQTINLHNEGSYWLAWSLKAVFACVTASETGGETPGADVHAVHERIDPEIREEFRRRKVMYVRNYNDGFGLDWQTVFQTDTVDGVEEYARENRIELEWKGGERLRTRQIRPAVRTHPKTGEALWFNHAAFFHISSRDPSVREALEGEFAREDLPYNTYYGDGGEISDDVVRHVLDAYEAEKFMFRWHEGDVHLFDNMRLAHGRQPYTGDRLILVALTEKYVGPEE